METPASSTTQLMNTQRTIPFFKIEGTGNDFILIDNRSIQLSDIELKNLSKKICARRFGVGSDGLIALEDSENNGLVMSYKNPDGSDAGMCGNGARCFIRFANLLGYKNPIRFNVHDKLYSAEESGSHIQIQFPLETTSKSVKIEGKEMLQIYTNTEHIVCQVTNDELDREDELQRIGRDLRYHNRFSPNGTNVNFITGTDSDHVHVQTYERGVENLTYACGTGAIASALAWHSLQGEGTGDFQYQVITKGGNLTIYFTFASVPNRQYSNITLEGPANIVFEGKYHYDPDSL